MDPVDFFKKNKYAHVSNLVSQELTSFLYNCLVIKACTNREFSDGGGATDDKYIRQCYADLTIETLSTFLLDKISTVTQKKLCPTYTYSRVYTTGEILKPHTDRPSCEYSITLNIGGNPWPIFMGEMNKDNNLDNGYRMKGEILLKPGEGIIYKDEELVHWRNRFEGDHCVQAFLHFIDMEGPHYPEWSYDKRKNIGYVRHD